MGKDLDQTRYCTNCGSTNVRAQMWVNPNTHEVYNHCTGFDEEYDNYCDCCKEFVELYTLRQLWKAFENYPVNNDDEIEADFLFFPAGTSKFDVWHWFDERCPNNLHDDLMY